MKFFELIDDVNKVSHDIWKHSNSNKKNKCANKSLNIASWIVISESDSGKWRECKIKDNDNIHHMAIMIKLIGWYESLVPIFSKLWIEFMLPSSFNIKVKVVKRLTKDEPEHSCQVSNVHDDHNQFENLQNVANVKNFSNFVVILIFIIRQ